MSTATDQTALDSTIEIATEIAAGMGAIQVGSEHLVLASLHDPACLEMFERVNMQPYVIRSRVPGIVDPERDPPRRANEPRSPTGAARAAIAATPDIAAEFAHDSSDARHLLIAVSRAPHSTGGRVLAETFMLPYQLESIVAQPKMRSLLSKLSARMLTITPHTHREAASRGHNYYGVEHLLIALVNEDGGTAQQMFVILGVDIDAFRADIEQRLPAPFRDPGDCPGNIPLSPGFRVAFAAAEQEAARVGSGLFTTADLLVGVLAAPDVTTALLANYPALTLERARAARERLAE